MNTTHSRGMGPHPVDVYVGSRVRLRRVYLGFSQDRVAKALGVTFQQIQKYERGTNRISASKLFEISMLLDVPVSFFFEGAKDVISGPPAGEENGKAEDLAADPVQGERGFMSKRETLQVITNYYGIGDQPLRRNVLALMKALSAKDD